MSGPHLHASVARAAASGLGISPRFRSSNPVSVLAASNNSSFSVYNLPHDDYGSQVNLTIWFLTASSGLFLVLRVYCKFLRHRGLWWDDHLLILSWVLLLASTGFQSYCVHLGFGKHPWDIELENFLPFLFHSNLSGFFSILAAVWSKTSFAMTLLRISNGRIRKFVWFVIVSVNIALLLSSLFQFVHCDPVQKTWNPMVKGKCWPSSTVRNYNIFTAAYSGGMDVILALLPWRIIWELTMNRKEKLGVLVAMSMGVFAGVTSIMKCFTLSAIGNPDLLSLVNLVILATAESSITIIAASIPILRALIRDRSALPPPTPFFRNNHTDEWTASLPTAGRGSTTITSSRPRSSYGMEERGHLPAPGGTRRQSRLWPGGLSRLSAMLGGRDRDKSLERSQTESEVSLEPPFGKIVQTDEVRIEFHLREIRRIGQAL